MDQHFKMSFATLSINNNKEITSNVCVCVPSAMFIINSYKLEVFKPLGTGYFPGSIFGKIKDGH